MKIFGHNDFIRHKQRVQELRLKRSSMGVNAGMPVHHSVAEVLVCCTDHSNHTNECENAIVHRKKS